MTIKVILQKQASGNHYSLESGLADNIKNFDHHKTEHKHYPSPSNNPSIPVINEGIIEISILMLILSLDCLDFMVNSYQI